MDCKICDNISKIPMRIKIPIAVGSIIAIIWIYQLVKK
jgi:hypothetical protein